MKLIAIDCALSACQIAVLNGDALSVRSEAMAKGHAERAADLAREAMAAAGLGFDQLDRIAVTVGPGSFAGVRVGLSFARGLAVALDRPCLGFSTMEVMARQDGDAGLRVAAIPAPDGLFFGVWRDGDCVSAPARLTIAEALQRLPEGAVVLGPGAAALGRDSGVSVASVAALARLAAGAEPGLRPADPLYLRPPYATLPVA